MVEMKNSFASLIEFIRSRESLTVIAIDGCSGSGKSTLSQSIVNSFPSVTLIHADDFFLPNSMRTTSRLEEVGGNINYEQLGQVIEQLRSHSIAVFDKFSCALGVATKETIGLKGNVVIVEGVYSAHLKLMPLVDVVVLLYVDRQTQLDRIRKRNEFKYLDFVNVWIPLEDVYFAQTKIDTRCDYMINTTNLID